MADSNCPLVVIVWIDSTQAKEVWRGHQEYIEDALEKEKDRFYSVGYLVHTTKNLYHLANSIHMQDDEKVSFGGMFSIPKGCAISIKRIKTK